MTQVESSVAQHDRMVRQERLQAERVRSDRGGHADLWQPTAHRFRPPDEEQDPAVDLLAGLVGPAARVIDVGAGGGRIAIPLAGRVREVVAVEPSPAMRGVLEAEAQRRGVANIRVVPSAWEEADVEPAELVFAAHVTYGVQDIEPFLRKLDGTATEVGALVTFADPPQHVLAPFWRYVYGEEWLRLPCRDELLDVLRELRAVPEVIEMPAQPPQPFGPPEEAYEELRRRLYIGEGNSLEARLRSGVEVLTVERDGLLWPEQAKPNERSLIWWRPGLRR